MQRDLIFNGGDHLNSFDRDFPHVHHGAICGASGQAAQANWTPTDEPDTCEWGYAPSWLQTGSPFCSNAKLMRKAQ